MRNKIIALMITVVLVLCLSGCSGTFEGSKNYTKRTGGRLQPTMMQDLSRLQQNIYHFNNSMNLVFNRYVPYIKNILYTI